MIHSVVSAYAIFLKFVFLALSALLPVVNPIGTAFLFLEIAGDADSRWRKVLSRKIAINSALFLMVVQFAGTRILSFFGVSLPVVQVAGGFALAAMGWSLLNKTEPATQEKHQRSESPNQLLSMSFYPLTFPLTVGPGCMVVTLTLSAHASQADLIPRIAAQGGLALGILIISASVYFCYAYADLLLAKISASAAEGFLKIISFILLCIGVQIMWYGIQTLTGLHKL